MLDTGKDFTFSGGTATISKEWPLSTSGQRKIKDFKVVLSLEKNIQLWKCWVLSSKVFQCTTSAAQRKSLRNTGIFLRDQRRRKPEKWSPNLVMYNGNTISVWNRSGTGQEVNKWREPGTRTRGSATRGSHDVRWCGREKVRLKDVSFKNADFNNYYSGLAGKWEVIVFSLLGRYHLICFMKI